MILRASSSIALMPSAKLPPECAALPGLICMNTPPLRPVTTLPLGRPGSELNTARARRASASMIGRQAGRADLLVGGEQPDQRRRRAAELLERREHEGVHHQPGLHVGDARPIGRAVLDLERPARRLALREHRVAMAHQQNRPLVAARLRHQRVDGIAEHIMRLAPSLDAVRGKMLLEIATPTASTPGLS